MRNLLSGFNTLPLMDVEDDYAGSEGEETNEENDEVEDGNDESFEEEINDEEESINKNDYIPKDVALKWKKELKESRSQLNKLKSREVEENKSKALEELRNMVTEKGYDEDFAELFTAAMGKITSIIPDPTDPVSAEVDIELEDRPELMKDRKRIIDKLKLYRKADPDFSVDDAVRLIGSTPKSKKTEKEIELEIEQRNAVARRQKKEPATSSGSAVKQQYKLTAEEMNTVKLMQKHHPGEGWNAKKYHDLMKGNN